MYNKYVVSYRKYIPIDFDDVIGQKKITETLKKAIERNMLSQSFLFCGPRGVGKTTCAKILARKVNNFSYEEKNSMFNILELDAASNNSVDDIRQIINQLNFIPQYGKYKVYIIDEVHMLSNSAFNAFLKILEDPPSHVIFILATTEKKKILSTIISRCQVYDFNRISVNDIKEYLINICKKENIEYEEDALLLISENSDGSLRDALSIFDRLILDSNNRLLRTIVYNKLGILDIEYCLKMTDFMIKKNIYKVLLLFDEIIEKGVDINMFITSLSKHFRNLLISRNIRSNKLLSFSEKIRKKYFIQSKKIDIKVIIKALNICNNTENTYKQNKDIRLALEIALINLSS
ncbi:DNA polymerase III subunit gamma/tau [Candidatus Karelsulcia muelleri]|uniref:DNA polymerase III subunit gamma/tau n=1 Tax=Candidatus Karelsulcia muelleri TaxID=336810 RepID=A0A3A1MMH2_9FLAO|nr:DNA polymerase III subunit gamma/tau [Candidatus Karelsulcia muelleri]RIU86124.1 DNA polymerase III subunit gamma/tau [Candidatus Karelsulcia muelleri]